MQKTKKKKSSGTGKFMQRLLALCCAVLMISSIPALFSSCAKGGKKSDANFVSISKDGKKISVKAPVENGASEVYLMAADLWQTSALDALEIAPAKVKGGEASASFRPDGNLSSVLCKGYFFAEKTGDGIYRAVSSTFYATDPKAVHRNGADVREDRRPGPIKGAVGNVSGLVELGAKYTSVTVDIGKMMRQNGGIGTMAYTWNGLTYYLSRDAVEALDREIRAYTDAGIYVSLSLVQTVHYNDLPAGVRDIAFVSSAKANGYAWNMTTREGAGRLCGFLDFLAARYGNGGEHGKACSFVIGHNVNMFSDNYASNLAVDAAVQNYVNAVRMAYNILLSHTAEGKVYISLGNNWNVASPGGWNSREFLSAFNNMASAGGDFFWQVAVSANASDLSNSAIWEDSLVAENPSFLSPANIEILQNLLATDTFICRGRQRHLLLTDFVVGGGDAEKQAASYAFAYYKCLDVNTVDALIYGQLRDSAKNTLQSGLYTAGGENSFSERKKIADVFASIDNVNQGDLSFVKTLIGEKWTFLYKSHTKQAIVRKVTHGSECHTTSGLDRKLLTDFTGRNSVGMYGGDLYGFSPAFNADFVELRYSAAYERPALYAALSAVHASDKAGVVTGRISIKELKKVGFLGLAVMAAGTGEAADVELQLVGYDKNGQERIYTATARILSNMWGTISVNVEDFLGDIRSDFVTLRVLASPDTAANRVNALWIAEIYTEAPNKFVMPVWLTVLLIVIAVAGALVGFVIWFRKNYTIVMEYPSDKKNALRPSGKRGNKKRAFDRADRKAETNPEKAKGRKEAGHGKDGGNDTAGEKEQEQEQEIESKM